MKLYWSFEAVEHEELWSSVGALIVTAHIKNSSKGTTQTNARFVS